MNDEPVMIPYYAHEGEMSRMERANKRLWIIIIILIISLIVSNAGWKEFEMSPRQTREIVHKAEQKLYRHIPG